MSRTIRSRPSSGCYMRRPHHINAAKLNELSIDMLVENDINPKNRLSSKNGIPPDPWSFEKIISHYRGQLFRREDKVKYG